MKGLVSVIIPVYNGEKTILKTLESIINQSYKKIEIIIVDDGSVDNSRDIINKISDNRIIYKKIINSGSPAKPRNIAIKNAKGEFIAFCDQDDIWYKNKIEKQINVFNNSLKKNTIGIVYSTTDVINSNGKLLDTRPVFHEGFLDQNKSFGILIQGCIINNCSTLIPIKVLNSVGLLNDTLRGNDDYELWLRITQKYGTLGIKEPLCAWRDTGSNYSAKKSKIYIENEKIFANLEKESTDFAIRNGHAKNLIRIIVSLMLEDNLNLMSKYLNLADNYPISKKAKLIILLFNINKKIGIFTVRILNKIGLISL